MKKILLFGSAFLALVFAFSSCSMEKRHYMKGYHIEWFDQAKKTDANTTQAVVARQETVTPVSIQPKQASSAVAAANTVPVPVATVKPARSFTPAGSGNAKTVTARNTAAKVQHAAASHANTLVNKAAKSSKNGGPDKALLIVLCFFIPWLAVGLATDWDVKRVIICLLLGFLLCIPGIVYAIIQVNKEVG
ncbi:MAG TPA: YqaE/Pmp3 family membrane protein [Bacteroidia bacterium]|nr:YqaE/Pmp3 family membrane protein [Bacteroidia bacterium]